MSVARAGSVPPAADGPGAGISRHLRFYQAVMVATLGVYAYYLTYRGLRTLNPDALAWSLLFYYAEVHGFVGLALYFFQIWHPLERGASPPPEGLTVDVFIPTYNEDPALLRKTLLACAALRYPHRTYVLDDGARPEVERLAAETGARYLARRERRHAKAGNLNHALAVTDGELVAVFDADYVPQPDFLDRTLGYFRDERVAFVQTPHEYYNVDSFVFRVRPERRERWNEQDVFYRLMMPGRDYWNAAFFAGTAAVIRRKALESIGGFATETITEDIQTTIRLYKRGWKGVYHNEVLSTGLAAKDLRNYQSQRLRWAEGNIHMLFVDNPLWTRGLAWPQRLCFFATVFGWFIGFPKLVYFLTPALSLVTGWYPIAPFDWAFLWRYLVFLGTILAGFKIASRGYGRIRYDEAYNMMNFFLLIRAALKSLLALRSPYVVTGKQAPTPAATGGIAPQLAVVLLCAAGVGWGGLRLAYGLSPDWFGLGIMMFWAGVNGGLAWGVVELVTRPYHRRREPRFLGSVVLRYRRATGGEGLGITRDLNEFGVALVTWEPLEIGERLHLVLEAGTERIETTGTVLYAARSPWPGWTYQYGVRFEAMEQAARDAVSQFCFRLVLPVFLHRFGPPRRLLARALYWSLDRRRRRRRSPRVVVELPVEVTAGGHAWAAVTEDVSAGGVALVSPRPLAEGERVHVRLLTPFGVVEGPAEIRRARPLGGGGTWLAGAAFVPPGPERAPWLARLARARRGRRAP